MSYRIEDITRLNNSVNGNPRYAFTLTNLDTGETHYRVLLSSDASFGYEVGNPGYRQGDVVDVDFTKAGRVTHMTAA